MKLRFLGTAPGKSIIGQSHSALLVERSESLILFDCGEGTTQKLLELNLLDDSIDYIVISHLHPDHFAGIFILLQSLYIYGRTRELTIYVPEAKESISNMFSTMYMFQERLKYQLNIETYDSESLIDIGIYPKPNNHLIGYSKIIDKNNFLNTKLAYSFIIEENNKRVLISADIESTNDIKPYIDSCDVLILDGIHPSTKSIVALIFDKTIDVYITHGEYKFLEEKFSKIIGNNIRLAKENEEINI